MGYTDLEFPTVLYDPVARQADDQSQQSIRSYDPPSEPDSNNLKSSEPLPWKDRPVDIYTPNIQNGRDPPSFPPGLANGNEYMYRLAQPPRPVERSLDELQRWWTTDTRAQGLSHAHLDQINQAQRYPTTTPTRRSTTTTLYVLSNLAPATCPIERLPGSGNADFFLQRFLLKPS